MSITVAQLAGLVKIDGAATATSQLLGVGAAFDAAGGGPLTKFKEGLSLMGFGLSNVGNAGVKSGLAISDAAVQMGGALWKVAGVAALVGAAVAVAIGVLAVKAAADFQQGLNRLRTGAGDTQDSFASLSKSILAVSVDTGQMTGPLTQAMYLILSSGERGAQAYNTLSVAARGAVIEQANVVDVANVVSGVMTNYGTHIYGAAQYMNGLISAVAHGKITLQDLSVAMGPIDPIAHQLGISFADVAAAMTTQTNAMIPAARAATGLRFMMSALENPTAKANTAMKDLGLSSVAVANEMKVSLPGALEMIVQAALKVGPEGSVPFNRAVGDMVGGIRGLSAFMALTGSHMKDFIANSAAVTAAMKSGAGGVTGWAIAQSNFNVQLDRAKASGQALLITIGQQLIPVLTQILTAVVPVVAGFTQWLISSGALHTTLVVLGAAFMVLGTVVSSVVRFFQQNEIAGAALKATLILAAAVIGGVLVFALGAAAVAAWTFTAAMLANPLTWIVVAIIAAIAGIILIVQHWGQIMTFLGGVFSWLGALAHTVFSAMGSFIGGVFSAIGTKIHDTLSTIGSFVGGVFSGIGTFIHDKLLIAATFVSQKITDIENFFKALPGKILAALATLGAILLAPFKWFYDHNTYVKEAVDAVVKTLGDLKAKVGEIFSAIGTTVHDKLTATKNDVGSIFSAIGTTIHDRLTATKNDTGTIFSAIGTTVHNALTATKNDTGNIFSAIGTTVHNALSATGSFVGSEMSLIGSIFRSGLTAVQTTFGNIFSTIGTLVHNALTGLWNWITGFLGGWPSQLFQAGVNIVMGLVNGLLSVLGRVQNAVGQIAGAIGNFLGFHSPTKEGPGRDADTWAPNLVKLFTGGLKAGVPDVRNALNSLMAPLSTQLKISAQTSLSGVGGAALATSSVSPSLASSVASGGGHTITIIVQPPDTYLDGVRMSRQLLPHLHSAIVYTTGKTGR